MGTFNMGSFEHGEIWTWGDLDMGRFGHGEIWTWGDLDMGRFEHAGNTTRVMLPG
jgi:hypothetical protein